MRRRRRTLLRSSTDERERLTYWLVAVGAALFVATALLLPSPARAADSEDAAGRPDTAGDLGSGAGALLGGILRVTPVLGQALDGVDGQRARLQGRRARKAAEREAERVAGMQFQQCVSNPCLYGAVCPQLFPHFIIPDCAVAAAGASVPAPPPPPRPKEPPANSAPPGAAAPAGMAGTFRPVPPETACLVGRTSCGPNCAKPVTAADREFCREVNNRRLLGGLRGKMAAAGDG